MQTKEDTGVTVELTWGTPQITDLIEVERLLASCGLPTQGVREHLDSFLLARWGGELAGTIGLEPYDRVALLRSLCVSPRFRGRAVGRSLIDSIEKYALLRGVTHLYLLTETAPDFFRKRGYALVSRQDVPSEIQATQEFQSLCPSTAECMHKDLFHAEGTL